jgi:hypothetical protein
MSFPQVKRDGNPSSKNRNDSGQAGMTAYASMVSAKIYDALYKWASIGKLIKYRKPAYRVE